MKLSTSVFALIASSLVYANNTDVVLNNLRKRQVSDDVMKKCDLVLKEYEDCETSPKTFSHTKDCEVITSDKCQKYFKDPIGTVSSCEPLLADAELKEEFELQVQFNMRSNNFMCQEDEKGYFCPLSDLHVENPIFIKVDRYEKIKEDTCRSDICKNASYDFYNYYINNVDKIELKNDTFSSVEHSISQAKEILEYLDSNKCKNIKSSDNSVSFGVSTLKIGSGLFITLGLILLSLY